MHLLSCLPFQLNSWKRDLCKSYRPFPDKLQPDFAGIPSDMGRVQYMRRRTGERREASVYISFSESAVKNSKGRTCKMQHVKFKRHSKQKCSLELMPEKSRHSSVFFTHFLPEQSLLTKEHWDESWGWSPDWILLHLTWVTSSPHSSPPAPHTISQ